MSKELHRVDLPDGQGHLIAEEDNGAVIIHRYATRGNVHNYVENYEQVDASGRSNLTPLTAEIAEQILDRIAGGISYSDAFIFDETDGMIALDMTKTEMEHKFTSTGIKFWRHTEQMISYLNGGANTVVSTHISPEGSCNLKCPYCSVTYRDTHSRIELDVAQKYVEDLQTRGLKAVILTGGGEPTAYPHFNRLVQWLKYERGLSVALITNGTLAKRVEEKTWKAFSWVRVSINLFDGWKERIGIPVEMLSPECVVGCSMVYTGEHEATTEKFDGRLDILRKAATVADKVHAKYVRLLPNCLLEQRQLLLQHRSLARDLKELNDPRFFHQHKVHGAPKSSICHQAFFRPYLSEEKFFENGLPGTVYPCDSVVLNESFQHFAKHYQICHASKILEFLDRKLEMQFDPRKHCAGCVFTQNVNMLDDWVIDGVAQFKNYANPIEHEEFV